MENPKVSDIILNESKLGQFYTHFIVMVNGIKCILIDCNKANSTYTERERERVWIDNSTYYTYNINIEAYISWMSWLSEC